VPQDPSFHGKSAAAACFWLRDFVSARTAGVIVEISVRNAPSPRITLERAGAGFIPRYAPPIPTRITPTALTHASTNETAGGTPPCFAAASSRFA
jgi:hypothetical protein